MKSRLSLIFAALVVLLGSMIWMVQDQSAIAPVPALAAELTVAAPAAIVSDVATAPAVSAPIATAPPVSQTQSLPAVHVDASGDVKYVARTGDTLSQLAVALLGSDSKEHRDAIIKANPSLESNPDLVLAGQTYLAPPVAGLGAKEAETNSRTVLDEKAKDKSAGVASGPKLSYIAKPGDTVRGLAGHLLGGDTEAHRQSIIAGNVSLQRDPDHLVAGESYTIVAPNGLAADPTSPQAKSPTTQPDADDVVRGASRDLRYTALTGDTVSKLALVLLGSDTHANRDVIINSNPSLKHDPDHLVAGKTYWITAPTVEIKP